jgi:hypothetical protein
MMRHGVCQWHNFNLVDDMVYVSRVFKASRHERALRAVPATTCRSGARLFRLWMVAQSSAKPHVAARLFSERAAQKLPCFSNDFVNVNMVPPGWYSALSISLTR